ncbi:MAG: alanine racemase [Erythrobacter sp.]|uniref:alanine racemase n=1 Tax=Erythrobacter sp. TaxID=1042 RepID=UPI00260B1D74|nr:alanine racemase [Erythrobacter sp.]MDJ0977725.1 alanine racemase [Erythrobacter sp.]
MPSDAPPEAPPPTLRLTVDTQALVDNWLALDRLSGRAQAGAAVKANAYGLGIETCVPALRDAGCDSFFVAHWSEVDAVMRHVPAASIAVLHGLINAAEIEYAKATGAVPVLNSLEQARAWRKAGGGRCHVMVDTGINRLGLSPGEVGSADIESLDIDILMSHLACADEDSPMNDRQLELFRETARTVPHRRASFANSAGIALGTDYAFDVTRPGLALYGGVPRAELADRIRSVARVEAAILQVRDIEAGASVGYNAKFTAHEAMRIATVSLGYADGFLRARGPGAVFMAGDKPCPVLGRVSMDMVVVDLAQARDLAPGDWIEAPFSLPHAARQSSVSQYELLTTIGNRLRG